MHALHRSRTGAALMAAGALLVTLVPAQSAAADGAGSAGAQAAAYAPPTAAQANAMRYGYTVPRRAGETSKEAIARQVGTYGQGIVRLYYRSTPAPWSRINDLVGGLPVSVSFKMSPQTVNTGRYDAALLAWFRSAPEDRTTWWSFHPEPEDDIRSGQYTAAQFRAAYARIAGLERRASNPRLVSTWMIMCYTVRAASGWDWRDYWPGSAAVDAVGFDCANKGVKTGTYSSPSTFLDEARNMARSVRKPWGLGEFASQLVRGDDGTRRAAWLLAVAKYLRSNGASFAMYFDADRDVDFTLHDRRSRAAWRSVVIDQTP